MRTLTRKTIEMLRDNFPRGCRVELTSMDDPQAPPIGTEGTVIGVDDTGTVHVNWDSGSYLGVIYMVDGFRRID